MEGEESVRGLLGHLRALEDPRQACKVVYPLDDILLVVLCSTLSGCDDFVEMAAWGRQHLGFLRGFAPFAHGVPSHDTLNDVINALDADLFEECFAAWIGDVCGGTPDIIALDGKTMRRSGNRRTGTRPLHVVSAWASRQRLVLAQEAVADKSNEITALPRLLERVALPGSLVTIDAIGCQREVAEQIVAQGADYVLALKANQRGLHASVRRAFEERRLHGDFGLAVAQTTDGDHGRIEVRRHFVLHDVAWLKGRHDWPQLAAVALIEASVESAGTVSQSRRYYLSSRPLDAAAFGAVVRGHWGIENALHWVLDVVFGDDHARVRSRFGPRNMALVKRMAINLLKAPQDRHSLKVRRKMASWSTDYLRALIQGKA